MRTCVKTSASVLHSMFVGLFVLGGAVQAQPFAGGTGGAGDPYRIATADQLRAIGSDPNLLDRCFMLVADIDLDPNLPGGRAFETALIAPDIPDANGVDQPGVPFTGSFDGRDHVIRNLVIAARTRYAVGLFGRIGIRDVGKWGTPGVVQNVRLEGVSVSGHESVGALAGVNEGTILNCSVRGSVTGERDFIGGLAGCNTGTVIKSSTEGDVYGHDYVGGLVGSNFGTVINSHATGMVDTGQLGEDVGGLVGLNSGIVADSYATGIVDSGQHGEYIGGLVGSNSGTVADSHATGATNGGEEVGGLAGRNDGVIVRCYASGDAASVEQVGGLVGENQGRIEACYATGNVTNVDDQAGGLVGANGGFIAQCYACGDVTSHETSGGLVGYNTASVTACYAVGRVRVTGDEGVGGLVGGAQGNPSTDSSFWDVDTTGFATRSNGGIGLHTADLQTAQTYLDAGWDFVATWMICEGVDYPRLQWEQYDCDDDRLTHE